MSRSPTIEQIEQFRAALYAAAIGDVCSVHWVIQTAPRESGGMTFLKIGADLWSWRDNYGLGDIKSCKSETLAYGYAEDDWVIM